MMREVETTVNVALPSLQFPNPTRDYSHDIFMRASNVVIDFIDLQKM